MQKLFVRGGGFEGVTTPAPTPDNFNRTHAGGHVDKYDSLPWRNLP